MPVFDYQCSDCGTTYDVYHKVREVVDDVVCPRCGSPSHKRLMSVPSISMGSKASGELSSGPSCESGGSCCGGACGLS